MRPLDAGRPGAARLQEVAASEQMAETKAANLSATPQIAEARPAGVSSAGADPLLTSLAQLQLNGFAAAAPAPARTYWEMPGIDRGVLYTKDGVAAPGVTTAAKQTGVNVPSEVTAILADGTKVPEAKKEFTTAQQALAAGDYTKAHGALESLMRKQGEDVLSDQQVKSTQTVRDQLGFLSEMQKAGIKADYPPSEAQLTAYFKTLKDKPAAARQAFEDYANSFHIHPAHVSGAGDDIKYSQTKVKRGQSEYTTDGPQGWADVSNRPAKGSEYAGRQMNDCQGYAFLAEKLLGAAGFKVTHNIAAVGVAGADSAHAMVMFTHPKESGFTLSSGEKTYHGTNAKSLARTGYEDVVGKGNLTGKEHFYTGKTQADAEIECVIRDHEL